jgi:hypothetical protein
MSQELTRREIQAICGLPPSTLTRELNRFKAARSGRGRYLRSDPGFGAWLAQWLGGAAASKPRGPLREPDVHLLPSGFILLTGNVWRSLRGPDESAAVHLLDRLIAAWKLPPHYVVPDELTFVPMALPSGTVVNATQWQILRSANERAAGHALDVLIRSFGVTE